MYILQNRKLYIQHGEVLVGVDVYPNEFLEVEGTETKLEERYEVCTRYEARCRFHLDDAPYIFPRDEIEVPIIKEEKKTRKGRKAKEVISDESIDNDERIAGDSI